LQHVDELGCLCGKLYELDTRLAESAVALRFRRDIDLITTRDVDVPRLAAFATRQGPAEVLLPGRAMAIRFATTSPVRDERAHDQRLRAYQQIDVRAPGVLCLAQLLTDTAGLGARHSAHGNTISRGQTSRRKWRRESAAADSWRLARGSATYGAPDPLEGGYSRLVTERRVGLPAVAVHSDFRAPLRYGDTAVVETSITRLGNRSLTLRYAFVRASDRVLTAEVHHTVVTTDLAAMKSCAMPDDVRRVAEAHLEPPLTAAS
jgi:hypothetical protein